MDPLTLSLILSAIVGGGQSASSFNAPQGTKFGTFAGTNTDPRHLLSQAITGNQDLLRLVSERALQPPNIRNQFVQTPPSFSGGGLPMPIGLTGRDTSFLGSMRPPNRGFPTLGGNMDSKSGAPGYNPEFGLGGTIPPPPPPKGNMNDLDEAAAALGALGFGRRRGGSSFLR